MGQYYVVVNLDKRQFLHPHKFGDGMKLLEFGRGGEGTMMALALLLAAGNGRGSGDHPSKSPLIGSWQGDRIVVAGDYANPGEKVPEELREPLYDKVYKEFKKRKDIHSEEIRHKYTQLNCTLYKCALLFFKDISDEIIEVMAEDPYLRQVLKEKLEARRLYSREAYPMPPRLEKLLFGEPRKEIKEEK